MYSFQLPVKQGDVLGFYIPGRSIIPSNGHICHASEAHRAMMYVDHPLKSNTETGHIVTMKREPLSWKACRTYSIRAMIKPTHP